MYRILLVDDEMPALRFLQAIIGKYAPDFGVCASYTNGAAALEYLSKYPVDLLITDRRLPEEKRRGLREHCSEIRFL